MRSTRENGASRPLPAPASQAAPLDASRRDAALRLLFAGTQRISLELPPVVAARATLGAGGRDAAELAVKREDALNAARAMLAAARCHDATPRQLEIAWVAPPARGRGSAPDPGAAAALPSGVLSEHLTGQPAESQRKAVDLACTSWRSGLCQHHARIAHHAHRARNHTLAAWHDARAGKLARTFTARMDGCGDAGELHVYCRGCGVVHERKVGCRLRTWCEPCATEWTRRRRKKTIKALGIAHRAAMVSWHRDGRPKGRRPDVALLTLTLRHSGDVREDARRIRKALPNLRRWLNHANGGSYAYVAAWEMTNGDDGAGHVHVHVAACLGFVPVAALAAEWARLTGGDGGADMSTRGKLTRRGIRVGSPESAARYVAKYAAKGIRNDGLSVKNAAAWVQVTHARRVFHASRGFYRDVPREGCECGADEWAVQFRHETALATAAPRGPPARHDTVSRETAPVS